MAAPTTPIITLTPGSGSFVASITGHSILTTHYLFYRGDESEWTSGGSRVGDGDITVNTLTEYCQYDVCVYSFLVEYSLPAFSWTTTTGTAATTIEQALYWKLANTTAISTLVGTRIYPVNAPPDADSLYIVYEKVSGPRVEIMGGKSGLANPTFQISGWASTYAAAKELGEQIRLALDGTVSDTWSGISIQAVNLSDDGETWEDFVDDSGKISYCVRQTYEIWHVETTS